jgi:hypothetical protein
MTSTSEDDGELIYKLACECEKLFDTQISQLPGQQTAITSLFTEYQQRFAVWAAHLGVFSRKSQCLDRRLRNLPDLQDLVVRLLDILRGALTQREYHYVQA